MDLIATFLLALIGIIIGFLAGILVQNLRQGEGKETPPDEPVLPKFEDFKELARLVAERKDEHLAIEMDGQVYRSVADLNEEQYNRLVMAASDLRTWLRIFPSQPSEVETSKESPSFPSYTPRSTYYPRPGVEAEGERLNLNPFSVFGRSIQDASSAEVPSKSIVSQIDEILQQKLENTHLADRDIRLVELPGEGIVVIVGFDKFNSVDDVPDEEIRTLIHAAVAEWENLR